jgi:cyclohexanecarboxylate-CoA ligase
MAEHGGDRWADIAVELAAELPDLERVLVADGPAQEGTRPFESFFFDTPWEERHGGELHARELGPDDPYLLLFTGA